MLVVKQEFHVEVLKCNSLQGNTW